MKNLFTKQSIAYAVIMVVALLFSALLPLHAQTPQTAPALTEVQALRLQNAVKDFQIAELQADRAKSDLTAAQQKVVALIAQLKTELKLDETWNFDFQSMHFVKSPTTPATPAPKQTPPAPITTTTTKQK